MRRSNAQIALDKATVRFNAVRDQFEKLRSAGAPASDLCDESVRDLLDANDAYTVALKAFIEQLELDIAERK